MPADPSNFQVLTNSRQDWLLPHILDRLKGLLGIFLSEHAPRCLDRPKCTVYKDGLQEWRLRGRLHRLDGPALIQADGSQVWYVDDKNHRLDGPAGIYANGSQYWSVDGKLHRRDGPAIIQADGSQEWYLYGKAHRFDGPAVIRPDGTEEWWINGHEITHLSAHAKLVHIQAYARRQSEAA